jgi:hypothetical protein
MAIQIQFRRDLASVWTYVNPILLSGEVGFEEVTGKFKLGNGIDAWNDLPYCAVKGDKGDIGITGARGSQGIQGNPVSGTADLMMDGGNAFATYTYDQTIDGGGA